MLYGEIPALANPITMLILLQAAFRLNLPTYNSFSFLISCDSPNLGIQCFFNSFLNSLLTVKSKGCNTVDECASIQIHWILLFHNNCVVIEHFLELCPSTINNAKRF